MSSLRLCGSIGFGLRRGAFLGEDGALAGDAPAVAAGIAILAHHAVAGDGKGDGIAAARLRDGTGGGRLADHPGDLTVRARAAVRDRAQGFPDAPLEGRRLDIERQVEVRLLPFEMADDR